MMIWNLKFLIFVNESSETIYSIDETNNNILIGSFTTDYKNVWDVEKYHLAKYLV
jgi:hypothetical protein